MVATGQLRRYKLHLFILLSFCLLPFVSPHFFSSFLPLCLLTLLLPSIHPSSILPFIISYSFLFSFSMNLSLFLPCETYFNLVDDTPTECLCQIVCMQVGGGGECGTGSGDEILSITLSRSHCELTFLFQRRFRCPAYID